MIGGITPEGQAQAAANIVEYKENQANKEAF